MKSVSWPESLRGYIAANYEYDRETGHITRKFRQSTKGPAQNGPLGTLTASGDLFITIVQNKVAYPIKVTRMAVFLETGAVYKKILWKDSNKLNNKWDNLIVIGNPLDCDGNELFSSAEEFERTKQEFLAKRKEAVERAAKERLALLEQSEKSANELREKKQQVKDAPPPVEEKIETYEEIGRKQQERKDMIDYAVSIQPLMVAIRELREEINDELKETKHENGIHTGMRSYWLQDFIDACRAVTGKGVDEFTNENEHVDKSDWPKWQQDYYFACYLKRLTTKGGLPESWLQNKLDNYKWQGEPYKREYGVWTPEMWTRFEEGKKLLEHQFGTTEESVRKMVNDMQDQIDRENEEKARLEKEREKEDIIKIS